MFCELNDKEYSLVVHYTEGNRVIYASGQTLEDVPLNKEQNVIKLIHDTYEYYVNKGGECK